MSTVHADGSCASEEGKFLQVDLLVAVRQANVAALYILLNVRVQANNRLSAVWNTYDICHGSCGPSKHADARMPARFERHGDVYVGQLTCLRNRPVESRKG